MHFVGSSWNVCLVPFLQPRDETSFSQNIKVYQLFTSIGACRGRCGQLDTLSSTVGLLRRNVFPQNRTLHCRYMNAGREDEKTNVNTNEKTRYTKRAGVGQFLSERRGNLAWRTPCTVVQYIEGSYRLPTGENENMREPDSSESVSIHNIILPEIHDLWLSDTTNCRIEIVVNSELPVMQTQNLSLCGFHNTSGPLTT